MPFDGIKADSVADVFRRREALADTLGKQIRETLFKTVQEACQAAGTMTNAAGRPISAELLLEAWEKVNIGNARKPAERS